MTDNNPMQQLCDEIKSSVSNTKPFDSQSTLIRIEDIHEFKNHPFKVIENDDFEKLKQSILQSGVIVPVLVRFSSSGLYEMISGHRRLAACQSLGMQLIPAIIRDLSDEEATIAMVDANLSRTSLLPSEKAYAYKMKMDALKKQGFRSDLSSSQVGAKTSTAESIGKNAGDSRNQVLRYIRLTYLVPGLLQMVDDKKLPLNTAVELSYLEQYQQSEVLRSINESGCCPTMSQARDLKTIHQKQGVIPDSVYNALATQKIQKKELRLPLNLLDMYFPEDFTSDDKVDTIVNLVIAWNKVRKEEDKNHDN